MNRALIALIVGAFLGSGTLMAQDVSRGHYPQQKPEETAKLKAESEAAQKAEANMTPEEKAAAKKTKRAKKQKELAQVEKVGNPNAPAKAEAVAKSHEATKSHAKPLPTPADKQEALTKQSRDPPGHYPTPPAK